MFLINKYQPRQVGEYSPTPSGSHRRSSLIKERATIIPNRSLTVKPLGKIFDVPFTVLEGAVAILETTGKKTDEPRKYLKVQKPKPGRFEATIPATQMKVLYLHWVDRYRH